MTTHGSTSLTRTVSEHKVHAHGTTEMDKLIHNCIMQQHGSRMLHPSTCHGNRVHTDSYVRNKPLEILAHCAHGHAFVQLCHGAISG